MVAVPAVVKPKTPAAPAARYLFCSNTTASFGPFRNILLDMLVSVSKTIASPKLAPVASTVVVEKKHKTPAPAAAPAAPAPPVVSEKKKKKDRAE